MDASRLGQEGLSLVGFGVGTVFVFLTLLVIATSLMWRVVRRCAPAGMEEPGAGEEATPEPVDETLMAVIAAAVHRYRQRQRR